MAWLAEIGDIYRRSKKRNDNFWTEWLSRPPAAVLVWLLKDTRVTPNQVSFAAIATAVLAAGVLIGWRDHAGLIVGGLLLQLAYVIDCVDGQLARLTGRTSPVGALLDFMLDEIKAFVVIAAAATRLHLLASGEPAGDGRFLLIGLGGLVAAATGITLTTFVRRPEYLDAIGAQPLPPATDRGGHWPARLTPIALVEAAGKYALHYPSWFLYVCAFNRLDLYLYVYTTAHVLYMGRASLSVLLKLGRFAKAPPVAPAQTETQ